METMHDTKMSFASFTQSTSTESHLFAYPDLPVKLGVKSTDILTWMGFGNGNMEGGYVSKRYEGHKLIFVESDKDNKVSRLKTVIDTILAFQSIYYVSEFCIKHVADLLAVMEKDEDMSSTLLQLIPKSDFTKPVADLIVCGGMGPKGDRFLGIGVDHQLEMPSSIREDRHLQLVDTYEYFHWRYSLPVGNLTIGQALLNELSKQHFAFSTIDIQIAMLDRVKKVMRSVLTRTVL